MEKKKVVLIDWDFNFDFSLPLEELLLKGIGVALTEFCKGGKAFFSFPMWARSCLCIFTVRGKA